MIRTGSVSAATRHPATSSFPHQPVFTFATNPFRFIALHTLFHNGISLLSSFHKLTHSLPSHGTRPPLEPNFHSPISNSPILEFRFSSFDRSLSSFFATLTNSVPRKSIVCHSYKNTRGGTYLFPIRNSAPSRPSISTAPFLTLDMDTVTLSRHNLGGVVAPPGAGFLSQEGE
jgi:hypothetical protein